MLFFTGKVSTDLEVKAALPVKEVPVTKTKTKAKTSPQPKKRGAITKVFKKAPRKLKLSG
jgi:hypothetical protein